MGNSKRQINDRLLSDMALDMFSGDDLADSQNDSLRVERILLDLVRPDPVQPRRVLPERLYYAFYSHRLTASQALRELIQSAQLAAQQHGRPFTNLLDLLGSLESHDESEPPSLSPEEQLVRDLVNLAVTIRDDGQVNPLTVVDVSQGVARIYRIETGERRYWATWLLRDFMPGYESDGMIPCIVIPPEHASPFRQAKENTARSGLSAVAMARQAALLLLAVHGYEIPDGPVTMDFYRQALDLDLRSKREHTADILAAMGGISKSMFSRYKALLRLSDEAAELADRHYVDEGILRHVIQLPADNHTEVILQVVTYGLTTNQVKALLNPAVADDGVDTPAIPRHTVQLARLMKSVQTTAADSLARALLEQERDVQIARARLHSMRKLIDEVERYLVG